MVIYSRSTNTMVILELSVCMERTIVSKHIQKLDRYAQVTQEIQDAKWKVYNFAVEVGVTGMISTSMNTAMTRLGLTGKDKNALFSNIARTTLRCTYILWLQRFSQTFDADWRFCKGNYYRCEGLEDK